MAAMSEETKKKIADKVRETFAKKREERAAHGGLPLDVPLTLRVAPTTVKMDNLTFDPNIFVTMKTGKPIDLILSSNGGMTKATNFVVVGDPGVGKSTVMMDLLSQLQIAGYKTLFISGEMDRIDLYSYVRRFPKFGNLDILFLGEYLDENPKLVIEDILQNGYDAVLLDSFVEVQDTVRMALKWTSTETEKWLIDLMRANNMAKNNANLYTSFFAIQQVTKGGVFVGSNKLKHNTHGMLELRFDEEGNTYAEFTKNRKGEVQKKMYYNLKDTTDVTYDEERYEIEKDAAVVAKNGKKGDDDDDDI